MKKDIRRLPDAEFEVMDAIWQCPVPAKRSEIDVIVQKTHPMAVTTLLTVITRLCEKGFIKIEKEGRISVYTPLITKEEYLSSQSKSFFEKLCGGSVSAFANALCSSGISKEELKQLKEMLEKEDL